MNIFRVITELFDTKSNKVYITDPSLKRGNYINNGLFLVNKDYCKKTGIIQMPSKC